LQALTLGVIDEIAILENVDADFVIVSVPDVAYANVLPEVLDLIGENTIF
jgi:prephenate dehydrogenase